MLKPKIRVTKLIITKIQEDRQKIGKSGIELSAEIGKSEGWLSLLENGRIQNITSKDLMNIFKFLHSFTDEEAEQYIEDFMNETKDSLKKKVAIYRYDEENKSSTEDGYKKMIEHIITVFDIIYDKNPEYAFDSIGQFMENLQFDTGFTLALNKIPFDIFEDTDHKIRQQLFDEIGEVVKKYAKKYVKGNNDESEVLE